MSSTLAVGLVLASFWSVSARSLLSPVGTENIPVGIFIVEDPVVEYSCNLNLTAGGDPYDQRIKIDYFIVDSNETDVFSVQANLAVHNYATGSFDTAFEASGNDPLDQIWSENLPTIVGSRVQPSQFGCDLLWDLAVDYDEASDSFTGGTLSIQFQGTGTSPVDGSEIRCVDACVLQNFFLVDAVRATFSPTPDPTTNPSTVNPTTVNPTVTPTANPTTVNPTPADTPSPTDNPTTVNPTTVNPTTANPTTANPTTANPTANPTATPTSPTYTPSASPTASPTAAPTAAPTVPGACPGAVGKNSVRLKLLFSDANLTCTEQTLQDGGQKAVARAAAFAAVPVGDFSCSAAVCVGDSFQVTSDVGGSDPYSVYVQVQDLGGFTEVQAEFGGDVVVPKVPDSDSMAMDYRMWVVLAITFSICLALVLCGKLYLCCHHKHVDLNGGATQQLAQHEEDVELALKESNKESSHGDDGDDDDQSKSHSHSNHSHSRSGSASHSAAGSASDHDSQSGDDESAGHDGHSQSGDDSDHSAAAASGSGSD